MELTICKMWKEPDELENGIYANEDNLIKLEKVSFSDYRQRCCGGS